MIEREWDAGILGPLEEGADPSHPAAPGAWHGDADASEKGSKANMAFAFLPPA